MVSFWPPLEHLSLSLGRCVSDCRECLAVGGVTAERPVFAGARESQWMDMEASRSTQNYCSEDSSLVRRDYSRRALWTFCLLLWKDRILPQLLLVKYLCKVFTSWLLTLSPRRLRTSRDIFWHLRLTLKTHSDFWKASWENRRVLCPEVFAVNKTMPQVCVQHWSQYETSTCSLLSLPDTAATQGRLTVHVVLSLPSRVARTITHGERRWCEIQIALCGFNTLVTEEITLLW